MLLFYRKQEIWSILYNYFSVVIYPMVYFYFSIFNKNKNHIRSSVIFLSYIILLLAFICDTDFMLRGFFCIYHREVIYVLLKKSGNTVFIPVFFISTGSLHCIWEKCIPSPHDITDKARSSCIHKISAQPGSCQPCKPICI